MSKYNNRIFTILFILLIVIGILPKNTYAEEDTRILFITGYNSDAVDCDRDYYNDIKNAMKENDYDEVIIGDYLTLQFALEHKMDIFKLTQGTFVLLILFITLLILVIVLVIRYLKYKRKHEDALRIAIDEAEEIDKLKKYFIVNMNHELKTPITVINSVMQLTKHKRKHYDNYLITKKDVILVEDNCQRLLRLVNNIIDLERIDSKGIDLFLENLNIVELIEDTVLSVVPFAKAKNVELIFDTTEEEVIMAVDRNKIERVVLNLLSNAIKYSKEAGIVDINIKTDFNTLTLIVEDDGIGMEEENMNKIFDRFVQLDSSLTRKSEGSGIGLAIVKPFVECHKGTINVESALHKGSKFTIEIPIEVIEYKVENNSEIIDTEANIKQELSDIYI